MQLHRYEIRDAETGEVLDRMRAINADSAKMVYRLRLDRWEAGTSNYEERMKQSIIAVEVGEL